MTDLVPLFNCTLYCVVTLWSSTTNTMYDPDHPLLIKPRLSRVTRYSMPAPGTKADVLFTLLRDRQWHTVEECFQYVRQTCGHAIDPTHFGQRILNRYIEVVICSDRVRLGKRHPA